MKFEDDLIRVVQDNPVLYETGTNSQYEVKRRIWQDIAKSLNCPVEDCRGRWTSLRDRFGREFRKQNSSEAEEDGAPTWKYFDRLSFLAGALRTRKELGAPFDENLIDYIRDNPVMYNSKSKSSQTFEERERLWAHAATKLHRSVTDCRKRWKALRDRFVREHRSIRLDDASSDSRWHLYEKLSFLRSSINTTYKPRGGYRSSDVTLEGDTYSMESDDSNEHPPEPGDPFSSIADNVNYKVKSECSSSSIVAGPSAKRSKQFADAMQLTVQTDDKFSTFLTTVKNVIERGGQPPAPPKTPIQGFVDLLNEKMKLLPLKERMEMEVSFLTQINSKLVQIGEAHLNKDNTSI